MKVYVVTSGCYSDYTIEKIFTDKQKAEEYKAWVVDANDIEEYDTSDDIVIEKYYKIIVSYTEHDMKYDNIAPSVSIEKCLKKDTYFAGVSYYNWSGINYLQQEFNLTIVRFIPEQNWNEEFYVNKYIKAMYDYIAIVKQKRLEGWSEENIQRLFNGYKEEV